jgi:hypothetical protein
MARSKLADTDTEAFVTQEAYHARTRAAMETIVVVRHQTIAEIKPGDGDATMLEAAFRAVARELEELRAVERNDEIEFHYGNHTYHVVAVADTLADAS